MTTTQDSSDFARRFLGKDFLHPREIASARGLEYSDAQVAELECTIPNGETLEWIRDNNHMLVAGPPRAMEFNDVWLLDGTHFSEDGKEYASSEGIFRHEKVTCGWLVIRKGPVLGSVYKTWPDQKKLLTEGEYVPNDAELVWAATTYRVVRGVSPLMDISLRVSSRVYGGYSIRVSFDETGLINCSSTYRFFPLENTGVASARRI